MTLDGILLGNSTWWDKIRYLYRRERKWVTFFTKTRQKLFMGNFIAQKTSVLQLMLQLLVFTPAQENKSQILLHLDIRQIIAKQNTLPNLPMYKTRNTGTGHGMWGTREIKWTLYSGKRSQYSGERRQTLRGMLPDIPGNVLKHSLLLKEMRAQGQSKISSCCFFFWCKSRELGGRGSPKFPCVTSIINYSYNKLLGRVAFRILSNIHDGALLRK